MPGKPNPSWLRRMSCWSPGHRPQPCGLADLGEGQGFPWFEVACGPENAGEVLELLGPHCAGLEIDMLEDLLTPDDEPEGLPYADGTIRLASTFSVKALREDLKVERGTPQEIGVLRFQPVELLAADDWLITCWHPQRTFRGPSKIGEEEPGGAEELFQGVVDRWVRGRCGGPGELGLSVMLELALSYRPAVRMLLTWLEDWELSLYLDDDINSRDQLPELWSLMAVLRSWLSPLNRPGLREDVGKSWLPATDHDAVIAVDDRVDKSLAELGRLSETLRQSFGLLHLEQAEEQRQHIERVQRRVEIAAAAFLVPTLIVGFYGANTWVPGQGRHWGFWVMVLLMIVLSAAALFIVNLSQRRTRQAADSAREERRRMRTELLGPSPAASLSSTDSA
jgi:CorA-like Mg2+ transporter protein